MTEVKKYKDYVIRAFNPTDKSCSCLAFRYDNSFFTAIEDILVSRNRDSSISFPVETDFFQLYRWKATNGMTNAGISFKKLEEEKFVFIDNYHKKVEDKNKIQLSRLHIVENTFHFSVLSYENISYNTEDLTIKFLQKLKNYHIDRLLAIV